MYCSTCAAEISHGLNYCNRCGTQVNKSAIVEKPSRVLGVLSAGTTFVGLGGLGLTFTLIAMLLNFGVKSEVVVILALAFLAATFGISFLMMRQISQMLNNAQNSQLNAFEIPRLKSPDTARLEEPRQPARSVTENTTRTLERELIK